MKTNDNFHMTGRLSYLINAQSATDSFDKDIQAEAAFNYIKMLFENGYPKLAMCFQLLDFRSKHPQSRHIAEANMILAGIYSKR